MAIYIGLLLLFLAASAFFSGMEAAIFSISRFRLQTLTFENKKGIRALEKSKRAPGRTLVTLLLFNLLVNIGASSVATIILMNVIAAHHLNSVFAFTLEFVIMTGLLLAFGEITPKVIAFSNAEFFALKFSGVIQFLSSLCAPVAAFSEFLISRISKTGAPRIISEDEIKYMIHEAKQSNIIDESEERIGYQILVFGKKKVGEVMTPKTKVVGVGIDDDIDRALALIRKTRHSRIVVFDRSGDVGGMLYAKDLFGADQAKIAGYVREPYFVPETKHLDTLLAEFRKKGIHCGVVVDEFGDFKGLVTLEDILETLFGEIVDEFDSEADLPYRAIDADHYIFDGDISVAEINQVLKTGAFGGGSERLAALILRRLGRFPKDKDTVIVGEFELRVEEIRNRAIRKVSVGRL